MRPELTKKTITNVIPGYATRDSHMTWSQDGHMNKITDCSKLKDENIINRYVAM